VVFGASVTPACFRITPAMVLVQVDSELDGERHAALPRATHGAPDRHDGVPVNGVPGVERQAARAIRSNVQVA